MEESIFEKISKFCHQRLFEDKETLRYLYNRDLTRESISKFQIGLFPKDLRELFDIVEPKELRAAGVIRHASSSTFKIQNLVMPVLDVYNNYIAIAGRTLLSEEDRGSIPKYKNSVYKKSHHLFGLNFAKYNILKQDRVLVVEGYFDVIMSHQKGMENVVATCGSFLSKRHVALLSRYTNNIILILDNEPDAQEKASKAVAKMQFDGINLVTINPFPKEVNDMDEYLRKHSVKELMFQLNKRGSYDDIRPLWG